MKCKFCGNELPEGAHFCPICARSLVEKETPTLPKQSKRKKWTWAIAGVVLLAVIVAIIFYPKAKTYDDHGSAEVIYQAGGQTYHLVLRNSAQDTFHWKSPQAEYSRMLNRDDQAAIPLQLYVYDEESNENAREAFASLVKENEIHIRSLKGNVEIDINQASYKEAFPDAMLEADLVYAAQDCEAECAWILTLLSGDTIVLHEQIYLQVQPEVVYSYETTPLTTMEEVQTLVDQAAAELEEGTILNITLAPIVYEGDLDLRWGQVFLSGTNEEGKSTIIEGSVYYEPKFDGRCILSEISLRGTKDQTGVIANGPFFFYNCSLDGYEVGVKVEDGGLAVLDHSSVSHCRIGVHYDSTKCKAQADYFWGASFVENETAILFEHLPRPEIFYLLETIFEGNETDIENLTSARIADSY
ncbi:MAG: zinc ribbon domain-containing protein [Lachnospiraceae bacterium]|nr:zinc ribbon domain-containing protein [Lachnospiraceae bacterium]